MDKIRYRYPMDNGRIMDGIFPVKAKAMVKEFILKYQNELEEMWETGIYIKLPPIGDNVS